MSQHAESATFADRLELFFGDAHDALSRVYARLSGAEAGHGRRLRGKLSGPFCAYAETLSTSFPFADRGPGAALLAEAIVPEPCFWTPAMPHCYRAAVELCEGDTVVARAERLFGLRTLGAKGRSLVFDGKRWVLRGVRQDALSAATLAAWHEQAAALVVPQPDDGLCEAASRRGVLVVAELPEADLDEIRRLARWPAVGLVVLPGGAQFEPAALGHNLLLAERFGTGDGIRPSAWADLAWCDVQEVESLAGRLADCALPVVAARDGERFDSAAAGRAACDRLQRELAGRVEVCGYVV